MTLIEDYTRYPIRGNYAIILRELITSTSPVSHDRLIRAVWGGNEDGGPENSPAALREHIHILRKRLKWQYRIDALWGQGFRLRKLPESVGSLE